MTTRSTHSSASCTSSSHLRQHWAWMTSPCSRPQSTTASSCRTPTASSRGSPPRTAGRASPRPRMRLLPAPPGLRPGPTKTVHSQTLSRKNRLRAVPQDCPKKPKRPCQKKWADPWSHARTKVRMLGVKWQTGMSRLNQETLG